MITKKCAFQPPVASAERNLQEEEFVCGCGGEGLPFN